MPANTTLHPFVPNFAVPPGESLVEVLEARGLSQADLAERTGRPKKTINEIAKGKAAITPETAIQLERVLGISSSFWNSLEQNYRAALARLEEKERLKEHVGWLSSFPYKEMIKRGWIENQSDKVELVQELLNYFGVASPEAWSELWQRGKEATAFRRSPAQNVTDLGLVATWLRQGEIEGRELECSSFDAARFKAALTKIRLKTADIDVHETCDFMVEECRSAGVAVVLVPEFPRLGICGATRWISPDKALIQLSLRYKRNDQFWFSFFHEAGHILLHGKRDVFVEQTKTIKSVEEEEADRFASGFLISSEEYRRFVNSGYFDRESIIDFARLLGIAPGIVVGRLQHDGHVSFGSKLNDLKVALAWAED
ncbi:HigA family addiction module antitoxin [Pseudogulbenkiania subflava]|uniref:Addiction module antidote protein, HigA family n=1 Tax=Pseudogulbenkiania subflava DSM 22618 TaxID=1123014 RepID=A0A1Y6BPE5_9NEIS|nr:HigA family addiction module antitoxin [Pseudogulbenkiania subflava]SMF13986.1 addiction module antidote protein, HigA family [Pseudogulbenkiania subflava DSM 22618]